MFALDRIVPDNQQILTRSGAKIRCVFKKHILTFYETQRANFHRWLCEPARQVWIRDAGWRGRRRAGIVGQVMTTGLRPSRRGAPGAQVPAGWADRGGRCARWTDEQGLGGGAGRPRRWHGRADSSGGQVITSGRYGCATAASDGGGQVIWLELLRRRRRLALVWSVPGGAGGAGAATSRP